MDPQQQQQQQQQEKQRPGSAPTAATALAAPAAGDNTAQPPPPPSAPTGARREAESDRGPTLAAGPGPSSSSAPHPQASRETIIHRLGGLLASVLAQLPPRCGLARVAIGEGASAARSIGARFRSALLIPAFHLPFLLHPSPFCPGSAAAPRPSPRPSSQPAGTPSPGAQSHGTCARRLPQKVALEPWLFRGGRSGLRAAFAVMTLARWTTKMKKSRS